MNDISYLSGVGQPEDLKDANLLVEVKSTAQKMDNLDIEILTVPEKKQSLTSYASQDITALVDLLTSDNLPMAG